MAGPVWKRAVAALSLTAAGVAGISLHEGRVRTAYQDPVKVWTVCDGHTRSAKEYVGVQVDDSTCDRLLREDVGGAEKDVKRLVKVPVTQEQYNELVDFVFNVGGGNFASSTLLRKINAGDCLGAGAEFPRWNRAGGKVLPGLTKRRADNRRGWESGCSTSGT